MGAAGSDASPDAAARRPPVVPACDAPHGLRCAAMRVLLRRRIGSPPRSSVEHYAAQMELTLRLQLTSADELLTHSGGWGQRLFDALGNVGGRLDDLWFRSANRYRAF